MGVNTKALKARIRSVDSTMHITKAMELVASSKIRRARERMEEGRFYREVMTEAFADLSASETPYSLPRDESLPAARIVIAGDRGLAGGYNNNVFKLALADCRPGDRILAIGKRTWEYFTRRGFDMFTDDFLSSEHLTSADCAAAARKIKELYDTKKIGRVVIYGTRFVSMLTQLPERTVLLPLARTEAKTEEEKKKPVPSSAPAAKAQTLYEPDAETVLAEIIPEYIAGVTYTAACEAYAAEVAARRSAMDTASRNASDMIDHLTLAYNRARQSAITQEITEIVAGSN